MSPEDKLFTAIQRTAPSALLDFFPDLGRALQGLADDNSDVIGKVFDAMCRDIEAETPLEKLFAVAEVATLHTLMAVSDSVSGRFSQVAEDHAESIDLLLEEVDAVAA